MGGVQLFGLFLLATLNPSGGTVSNGQLTVTRLGIFRDVDDCMAAMKSARFSSNAAGQPDLSATLKFMCVPTSSTVQAGMGSGRQGQ